MAGYLDTGNDKSWEFWKEARIGILNGLAGTAKARASHWRRLGQVPIGTLGWLGSKNG